MRLQFRTTSIAANLVDGFATSPPPKKGGPLVAKAKRPKPPKKLWVYYSNILGWTSLEEFPRFLTDTKDVVRYIPAPKRKRRNKNGKV